MLPVAVVGLLAFATLAVLAPELAAALSTKEGPLEHLGHGLLLLAGLGWLRATLRARGDDRRSERRLCAALALACVVILGEELDWGGVYGFTTLADVVHGASGRANLHNAWHGASYVVFAALPLLLVGVVGWRRGDAPGRLPGRRDAIALAILGVASLAGSLVWPTWEPRLDEVVETLLYVGLMWLALRPVAASGLSTSTYA
jgi:hypothetical protein